jgi:hypothetical protein
MQPRLLLLLFVVLTSTFVVARVPMTASEKIEIAKLQREIPAWRERLNAVNPAALDVSYPEGKAIEQGRDIALQLLATVESDVSRLNATEDLQSRVELVVGIEMFDNGVATFNILLSAAGEKKSEAAQQPFLPLVDSVTTIDKESMAFLGAFLPELRSTLAKADQKLVNCTP